LSAEAVTRIETEPHKRDSARILNGSGDVAKYLGNACRSLHLTASVRIDGFMSAGPLAEHPASGGGP